MHCKKLESALEESRLIKIDYEEKVKLLADEDERLMTQEKIVYKARTRTQNFKSKISILKKLN